MISISQRLLESAKRERSHPTHSSRLLKIGSWKNKSDQPMDCQDRDVDEVGQVQVIVIRRERRFQDRTKSGVNKMSAPAQILKGVPPPL